MALLVRNLLICFLFTALCMFMALLWFMEHRHPTQDYSEIIERLNNDQIVRLEFTGNRVAFTDRDNHTFVTTVADVSKFLERVQGKHIRVIVKEDRFNIIYMTVISAFIVMLIMVVWWSSHDDKKEEENLFASDKLVNMSDGNHQLTFDDIAGIPEAKEELEEIVSFLRTPEHFQKIGAKIPKGILLQGPPGTGKTMLAKAVAGEAKVPFYCFSGSDFVEMFVGVGASRVRDLFKEAKKNTPCIVFIDEIDAVGASRSSGGSSGGQEERGQTLNALLVEMDGFDTAANTIVVLAATNRPDILDSALKRPGRFDRQINIMAPDVMGRLRILEVHGKRVALHKEVNLETIAKATPGFTGAELANLVNEAALMAAREHRDHILDNDFERARDRILMGVERKGMVMSSEDRNILAFHEAGHGILANILPKSDPLHKITIVPRGMALGQTQQLPISDHPAYSKEYLRSKIIVLMGGRAAEEIIFQQQTTGAQGDLLTATQIATDMICKWGMSDRLGPQAYSIGGGGFLDGSSNRILMGEETARRIDQEVNQLLSDCYGEAIRILQHEQELLKRLATSLLEVETLDGEEFKIIVECGIPKGTAKGNLSVPDCSTCPVKENCIQAPSQGVTHAIPA